MARRKKQIVEEPIIEERYPQMDNALTLLAKRKGEVGENRAKLIQKWIDTLNSLDKQMRHLERLEEFSTALKNPEIAE